LGKFADMAVHSANKAKKVAQTGVAVAGGIVDAVGLKDAEKMAQRLAMRGRNDASKAVNKARRLAHRTFVFEDEESMNYEFDLLLSNAGAVEKNIAAYGNYSPMFSVPAGATFVYRAKVKKMDIALAVREVRDGNDSATTVLEPSQRYNSEAQIQGRIAPANYPRTINLFFDNSHSPLQGKTIVYWVAIGENVSLSDENSSGARTKEMIAAEEGPSDTI
jgi:hypothetical protein